MTENGYFKVWRRLFGHHIWKESTPEQKTVLIVLMGMANHDPGEWEWKGTIIHLERGQMITSLDEIVKLCGKGVTIQNVRTALKRFENLDFLTNESTKSGRLITIQNYSRWQGENSPPNKASNSYLTNDQQTANKELTDYNYKKKNKKNNNKYIYTAKNPKPKDIDDMFERLWKLYPNKRGKGQVTDRTKRQIYDIGEEQMAKAISRYIEGLQIDQWRKPQNGSTFFNKGYVDYLDDNYEKPAEPVQVKQSNEAGPQKFVPEPPKYQKFQHEEWEDTKVEGMPEEMRRKMRRMKV